MATSIRTWKWPTLRRPLRPGRGRNRSRRRKQAPASLDDRRAGGLETYGRVPPHIVCGPAPCWVVVPLRGETAQHRAKPCPLIWSLGTAAHDAAIAGCLPPILAPADADLPGKPDPADRAAGLDRVERDPYRKRSDRRAMPMRAVS